MERDQNLNRRASLQSHHRSISIVFRIVEVVDLRDNDIGCEYFKGNLGVTCRYDLQAIFAWPHIPDLIAAVLEIG